MLIVAIPKSGSTAIMETLGKGHAMEYTQLTHLQMPVKRGPVDPRAEPLLMFHADVLSYDSRFLHDLTISRTHLYKQHITPTTSNRAALAGSRTVVLLREPEAIVDSYHRAFTKGIHRVPKALPRDVGIAEWREFAKASGLLDSLRWYHEAWSTDPDPNWLFLDFDRMTQQPADSILTVERHLGLVPSGRAVLRKARYSKSVVIPYRHNRIWRDRVAGFRAVLNNLCLHFGRTALMLIGRIARYMPAGLKRSAWARRLRRQLHAGPK